MKPIKSDEKKPFQAPENDRKDDGGVSTDERSSGRKVQKEQMIYINKKNKKLLIYPLQEDTWKLQNKQRGTKYRNNFL